MALEWNLAADEAENGTYPFDLTEEGGLVQADLRPLVRTLVEDLVAGLGPHRVSARFHEAMADVAAALVRQAAAQRGPMPVVLTGGCFQNARLAEGVKRRLQEDFDVRLHGEVPPGDGRHRPRPGAGGRRGGGGMKDAPDGVEWEGREG